MKEEYLEHINGLIYHGFFYKIDSLYTDELMNQIKSEIEKKINKKLNWEQIKYQQLEE